MSGLQPGDSVTGLSQAFASKNVMGVNGSTLNVTGYTINDGNSGNNYAPVTLQPALVVANTLGPNNQPPPNNNAPPDCSAGGIADQFKQDGSVVIFNGNGMGCGTQ